jgi:hypothetical protein
MNTFRLSPTPQPRPDEIRRSPSQTPVDLGQNRRSRDGTHRFVVECGRSTLNLCAPGVVDPSLSAFDTCQKQFGQPRTICDRPGQELLCKYFGVSLDHTLLQRKPSPIRSGTSTATIEAILFAPPASRNARRRYGCGTSTSAATPDTTAPHPPPAYLETPRTPAVLRSPIETRAPEPRVAPTPRCHSRAWESRFPRQSQSSRTVAHVGPVPAIRAAWATPPSGTPARCVAEPHHQDRRGARGTTGRPVGRSENF